MDEGVTDMFATKQKNRISAWVKRLLGARKPAEAVTVRPLQRLSELRPCSCGEKLSEGWVCKCNYHLIVDRDK